MGTSRIAGGKYQRVQERGEKEYPPGVKNNKSMARLPLCPSEPTLLLPWGIAAQILIYWNLERFVSCHFLSFGSGLSRIGVRRLKGRALGEGDALLSQKLSSRVNGGPEDRKTISQGANLTPCN